MPFPIMLAPLLAAGAQAAVVRTDPVVVTGRAGIPFISPMGEPIRARSPGEDTLARWFAQADLDHDGLVTRDEMVADATRFFAILDSDHDGEIGPEELIHYEWKVAPEIQVNARDRRMKVRSTADSDNGPPTRSDREDRGLRSDGGPQGAARYALLNMPEPGAAADADLDRAITLQEFRQAAVERFALLDRTHAGKLTLAGLEAMLPPPPSAKRRKHRDDEADTRIGVPLPPG